jgi:signal transduction histidine kinase
MLLLGVLIPFILVSITIEKYHNDNRTPDFMEIYNDYIKEKEIEGKIELILEKINQDYSNNPSSLYEESYFEDIENGFIKVPLYISVNSRVLGKIYGHDITYDIVDSSAYHNDDIIINRVNYQKYLFSRGIIKTSSDDIITIEFSTSFPIRKGTVSSNPYTYIVITFVVLIAIYIALVIWVSSSIHKPLNRLQRATKRFSKGDYTVRIREYSNDKFGEVSRTFDKMCDEREEANILKEKYEENRRVMLASISHDLKTPLTAIKVNVEAINDGILKSRDEKIETISVIKNKIDYMQHLIEELFLYSKLDTDNEQFNFRQVPLNRFIEDVVEEWEIDSSVKDIKITFDYNKDERYSVNIDVDKMKRVVDNILSNSVKHSGVENLEIAITLSKDDLFYELQISDNGRGVKPENLGYLFDTFYRLDDSRNSRIEGNGLGLAIAKRIIDNHNGIITAHSDVDEGMSILIQLPFERSET